jgi:hypothetical protein
LAGRSTGGPRSSSGWPERPGRINVKYRIEQRPSHLLITRGNSLIGGVLGAGAMALDALTSTLVVIALVVYFLAGIPASR